MITGGAIIVVAAFFAFTNPSPESLKKDLPSFITVSSQEMKTCVQVGRSENNIFFSRFTVKSVDRDGHLKWKKDFIGFMNNFYPAGESSKKQAQQDARMRAIDSAMCADSLLMDEKRKAREALAKSSFDPSKPFKNSKGEWVYPDNGEEKLPSIHELNAELERQRAAERKGK
jgi:hypothetical protein